MFIVNKLKEISNTFALRTSDSLSQKFIQILKHARNAFVCLEKRYTDNYIY
jgi:hypothetical protein